MSNNRDAKFTTVKAALLKHLNSPFKNVRSIIEKWVETATHLRIEGSRFLNFVLMKQLQNGLPPMNDTFIRLTFSKLLDPTTPRHWWGNSSTQNQQAMIFEAWEGAEGVRGYKDIRGDCPRPSFDGEGASQVLTWVAKDYQVNFKNHVQLNFYRRLYGVIVRKLDTLVPSVTKSRRRAAATVLTKFIVNFDPNSENNDQIWDNLREKIWCQLDGRGEGGVAGLGQGAKRHSV
jgi:hypothetical protein